ncbi:hypothetical protein Enr13x_15890 [Stieleria neptunia]|uniref:Uncharacterized protein n=1 Tax=Stieleria neptunia TaxID=2527979 RepID=A0A518HLM7_9BACT|nr:hypothetical protein [Stieleria neptunia]QDV41746.1 hypothetical protein Enr13x_15890 [Stieleria neptunia]
MYDSFSFTFRDAFRLVMQTNADPVTPSDRSMNNPPRNPAARFAARWFAARFAGRLTVSGLGFPRLPIAVAATLIALATLPPLSVRAGSPLDAELFSEISMSETVVEASQPVATPSKSPAAVLGAASLSKLLSAAGIECAVESLAVRVDLAELLPTADDASQQGTLQFRVDADADRIDAVLPMDRLPIDASGNGVSGNDVSVNGEKLMALLVALQRHDHVQLIASGKTLALHTSLSNQGVTADRLRTAAERLTLAATKTASITTTVLTKASVAEASTDNDTPPAQPATTPAAEPLDGTWSAKTSANDAWAVRFDADGKFVMVHTKSGKNSVSRGTYQTTGDRLVLSESAGVTLTGTLERPSSNAFRWRLQNAGGDVVATLAFSKQ